MNELDLLLAEIVEASRQRRQTLRTMIKAGKRGKINLARPFPKGTAAKGQSASA